MSQQAKLTYHLIAQKTHSINKLPSLVNKIYVYYFNYKHLKYSLKNCVTMISNLRQRTQAHESVLAFQIFIYVYQLNLNCILYNMNVSQFLPRSLSILLFLGVFFIVFFYVFSSLSRR